MNPTVQAIVDQISVERDRFERFCRSLSDEELCRAVPESTWQVRDFIAHLATVDPPVRRWFEAVQSGSADAGRGGEDAGFSVDRFNDDAVAVHRGKRVDDLLGEAAVGRVALVETLSRFTEEQLNASIYFGGDAKRPPMDFPLLPFLQGWARHDIIHVADMLKALPERRDDPLIIEWCTEPGAETSVARYQRLMR